METATNGRGRIERATATGSRQRAQRVVSEFAEQDLARVDRLIRAAELTGTEEDIEKARDAALDLEVRTAKRKRERAVRELHR